MTPLDLSGRFTRQADLVPQEKLQTLTATVIGVGAVGRQVALQLAAIGIRHLQLFDFDTVEPTNITTQGYGFGDLNKPKVLAMQQAINRIDPEIIVTPIPDRFRASYESGEVVFCSVDKIDARKAIWRMAGKHCRFWSDGRMLGETIRVLSASNEDEPETLRDDAVPRLRSPSRPLHGPEHDLRGEYLCGPDGPSILPLAAGNPVGPRSRREPVGE